MCARCAADECDARRMASRSCVAVVVVVAGGHRRRVLGARRRAGDPRAPGAGPRRDRARPRDPLGLRRPPPRRVRGSAPPRASRHVALRQEPGRGARHRRSAWTRCARSSRTSPRRAGQDADTLEAIVFLESAGRPDAPASPDLQVGRRPDADPRPDRRPACSACKVDVAASTQLTRGIARADERRAPPRAAGQRRRVDERFDPRKALAATDALPRVRQAASSAATTSPSRATTWASATCSAR